MIKKTSIKWPTEGKFDFIVYYYTTWFVSVHFNFLCVLFEEYLNCSLTLYCLPVTCSSPASLYYNYIECPIAVSCSYSFSTGLLRCICLSEESSSRFFSQTGSDYSFRTGGFGHSKERYVYTIYFLFQCCYVSSDFYLHDIYWIISD